MNALFASDNVTSACPEVMDAVIAANSGIAGSYGDDEWSLALKNKLSEIWGTEACLYYPGKYAGTCDACGVYEGQETIIDFKQSNKPKKEEWIEDYYLQLGAYSLAHNAVYNSRITQGIVLLCTVDNLFQDFRIQGAKLEEYQNKFLEKVEQFYNQRNMN